MRKVLTLLLLLSACQWMWAQSPGLTLHYVGANNVLIRVDVPKRYLLLPIEEDAPDATVHVLADNACVETVTAKLAINRVDYLVPFDLQPYKDQSVLLDVRTGNSRANVRDAMDDACWEELRLSDTFDTANRERFRPAYHHTAPWGWMNDPNGMFYKDGTFHLCYQYNPYGSMWGNLSWGHSTSRDLLHWEAQPKVLRPDGLGMVFSGSAVVDEANTAGFGPGAVVAMYTSAGASQMQSLAYSTDGGRTFKTYPGNPVITSDKECRDPHVFRDEEHGKWVLVLAAALEHEIWIYSSTDLKHWTKESAFGGYGSDAGVWECPDLMQLPVGDSGEKKWVLLVSINPGGPFGGSATQYFVGDFDGKTFTCESRPEQVKWMDYGKDHYATVTWSGVPDGRHIAMAWMSNWQYANEVPTKQFRSANALPRDLSLYRDEETGECFLSVLPVKEVESLRGRVQEYRAFTASTRQVEKKLPQQWGDACEIVLELLPRSAEKTFIRLSNPDGEKVVMCYDRRSNTFSMDRTQSGITDFSRDFPAVTVAPCPGNGRLKLRLFLDRCSLEAFEADGRMVMTNLLFPNKPYTMLSVYTESGSTRVRSLDIYEITGK